MSSQNLAVRLVPEPIQSLAAASVLGTYVLLGTLHNPSRILQLQNLTDQQVMFSFNGVDDHVTLPSSAFILLDLTANRTNVGVSANVAQGTKIYVKQVGVPTTGSVYLTTFYGAGVTV